MFMVLKKKNLRLNFHLPSAWVVLEILFYFFFIFVGMYEYLQTALKDINLFFEFQTYILL